MEVVGGMTVLSMTGSVAAWEKEGARIGYSNSSFSCLGVVVLDGDDRIHVPPPRSAHARSCCVKDKMDSTSKVQGAPRRLYASVLFGRALRMERG